jgi:DNA-binding NarL/FixJ family response regulator
LGIYADIEHVNSAIVICHESPSVRSVLREQIAAMPGVARVTTAATMEDLLARVSTEDPALILIGLERAAAVVPQLRRIAHSIPVIAIAMPAGRRLDVDQVRIAASVGVRGFLRADARGQEINALIAEGLAVSSPSAPAQQPTADAPTGTLPLTKREIQVLAGMSRGRSNSEIGKELFLSEDTIKTHARRLYRKLGACDRAQAVAIGFRQGLLR